MKRKVVSMLMVGALIFSLTACGGTSSLTSQNGAQEEIPEYKELTDPRGETLESTATGESNPQIVETKYETKDVVVADFIPTEMGYAVDPTGKTDSTSGIQQALFDCYEAGGGTVYLPAGNYAISDTVYIPPYVSLRGDWQDPDEGTEYGTIISVWMESDDSETSGIFELGSCSGAIGLTVYYPLQSIDLIVPYPYTFFSNAYGANYTSSTVRDVTIINGYRGIGTLASQNHESFCVDNVKGTFLECGLGIKNSSDVGTVKNFVVSTKYWKEATADCMNAVPADLIDAYTKQYTTGMEIADLEWTTYSNVFIENCAIGIHCIKGQRQDFAGSLCDLYITDCAQGLVVDGLDSRWGAVITRGRIEGGIVHNVEGKIKLCGVEVVGDIVEKEEGSVLVDETDMTSYEIDYDKYYTKPVSNLIVADIPNGLYTDAGPDLQKALNDMAAEGGGVVYVPGGTYRFKTPVTVPAGVELRGTSAVATRDINPLANGTVFLCYYGDDADCTMDEQAFITLAGENAGMNGVRITYPENGSVNDDMNSTYTVRGTASGVYVVNSSITASSYGIDFTNCDNHYVGSVNACCYINTYRLGGTGGVLTTCLQNPTVQVRTSNVGLVDWISEADMAQVFTTPILRQQCEYVIVEDAKDQIIYNVFAYAVSLGVKSINSENTIVNNIGNDNHGNITPQFYVDGGSMVVANAMRLHGYSYELVKGKIECYSRIAINEVGEKTVVKEK